MVSQDGNYMVIGIVKVGFCHIMKKEILVSAFVLGLGAINHPVL
jgi:hypothetical protein